MALDDVFNVTRPNQRVGGTNPLELAIEHFTGVVEGTIARRSATAGWLPVKSVRGTTTIRDEGVGGATIQAITPGAAADGSGATKWGKNALTIEKHLLCRETMPLLDTFQTDRDKRIEIGEEQGKTIAKFIDNAMLIQTIKASQLTNSTFYNNATELPGHSGGSIVTFANAGDATDPALIEAKLLELLATMEGKDIDPHQDGLAIFLKPAAFYTLLQSERLINSDYVTALGNSVQNGFRLKAYGIPVISTNNYAGGSNVTSHLLSTTLNGNAFNGNFTKVFATVASPKAVLAGETIPVTSEIFYEQKEKLWFIDSHMSLSATPRRAEHAGSIVLP